MNRLSAISSALLIPMVLSSTGLASAGPGTTAAEVLNLGVGARSIAMGEAYTALADDSSSLYWNPAGLAIMSQGQASFMYDSYLQGLNQSHAAGGVVLPSGGVGASLDYLSYGKIAGTNDVGDPTGDVSAYNGVATVGGALLGDPFSVGASIKGLHSRLADVSASGVAFDLGAIYLYPHEILNGATLRLGTTVRNIGPSMKFLDQSDPLPTQVRVGASVLRLFDDHVNISADLGQERGLKMGAYTGVEYWLMPMLALRAGYVHTEAEGNGLRAGIGLRHGPISFDYSYANYGDLGMTSRYEMTFRFGEVRSLLTPEERAMLKRAEVAMSQERYDEAVLILDSLQRLVPTYRPVMRLLKYAMAQSERQDRLAAHKDGTYKEGQQVIKRPAALSDLDEIEALLNLGSDDKKTQVTKSK